MPFLPPNQQRQSTEGTSHISDENEMKLYVNFQSHKSAEHYDKNNLISSWWLTQKHKNTYMMSCHSKNLAAESDKFDRSKIA